MSQISPDGRYIITTIAGRTEDIGRNYYVANFKDYRFLQVFYATRGILVYYDRLTGHRRPLHGADDPRYVQTNAVWSPDGHYLVFARAEARDAYPPGRALALFANDPRETRIQYDLYRIPFNGGEGGAAEPIPGASHNDMSNSFPKISPDGRWMVFVQSRNGSLMRPDSRLFIVPAAGGSAREMKANLPVMNSWHSFSPSGRWMVFSSKARSPFTQMYLTHIDDDGNDTPAIRIENATAANRAVNIPEFVNIRPEAWLKIDVPAVEFYHRVNRAWELSLKGDYRQAVSAWEQALQLSPGDVKARNNLAVALSREGRLEEAIGHWEKALAANPAHAEVRRNLGEAHSRLASALLAGGKVNGAVAEFRKSVEADPRNAALQNDLGVALLRQGSTADAEAHFRKALETDGAFTRARHNLGNALYLSGNVPEALVEWEDVARREPRNAAVLNQIAWVRATAGDASVRRGGAALELAARAVEASNGRDARYLDTLAAAYAECGRYAEAVATAQQALTLAAAGDETLAAGLRRRLGLYRSGKPFRQGME